VTLSLLCLVLGAMVVVDIGTGGRIGPDVYAAVVLTVVALGLIVGAWLGRARWLIPIGVVATIALAIATADRHSQHIHPRGGDINATPASVIEIQPEYSTDVGDIRLDLSRVDFGNQSVNVHISVGIGGSTVVVLPPDVDATVNVDLKGGDLQLFERHFSGLNQHQQVIDLGRDGSGGGQIHITADVNFGDVEVHR
jgi:hypothetical protein